MVKEIEARRLGMPAMNDEARAGLQAGNLPGAERPGRARRPAKAITALAACAALAAPPGAAQSRVAIDGDGVYVVICAPGGARKIRLDDAFLMAAPPDAAPGEPAPTDAPGGHGACHAIRSDDRKATGASRAEAARPKLR